jgi:hypothetical protein
MDDTRWIELKRALAVYDDAVLMRQWHIKLHGEILPTGNSPDGRQLDHERNMFNRAVFDARELLIETVRKATRWDE